MVSTDCPAAMKIITTRSATPKYKPIEASTKIKISFQPQSVRMSSGNFRSSNSRGVGPDGALGIGAGCSGGNVESGPDISGLGLSASGWFAIRFDECRSEQRHQDLVMASDGDPLRFGAARAASCRALHYILHRTIVLNEIKICGGDGHERSAQISRDGDCF